MTESTPDVTEQGTMRRMVIGIRSHLNTRAGEWALSAGLALEGYILLTSDLDTFHSAKAYAVLLQSISERTMGAAALSLAAFWGTALFLNGTFFWFRRVSPWIRSMSAFAASFYWAVFAVSMVLGNLAGTGWVNHVTLSALALIYSVRTAHEVGAVDREAKRCRHRSRRPRPT